MPTCRVVSSETKAISYVLKMGIVGMAVVVKQQSSRLKEDVVSAPI